MVDREQHIRRVISEQLGVALEDVQPSVTLTALGADELDLQELPISMEDEFGIELTVEDAAQFITVESVVQVVTRKVAALPAR